MCLNLKLFKLLIQIENVVKQKVKIQALKCKVQVKVFN